VFLEVRIPKELVNWQTKQDEQVEVKSPHAKLACGHPKIQKQDSKSKVKDAR
jgi:hypothetical protein